MNIFWVEYNNIGSEFMNILITNEFINCLLISSVISIIDMALIQKFKELPFVNTKNHIFLLNLIFSFVIGIPFSVTFYKVEFYYSIWISIFSFIGSSNIYEMLKKQNIVNYTPFSLSDKYKKKSNDTQ